MIRKILLISLFVCAAALFFSGCSRFGLKSTAPEELASLTIKNGDQVLELDPDEESSSLKVSYFDGSFDTSGVVGSDYYEDYIALVAFVNQFDASVLSESEDGFFLTTGSVTFSTSWDNAKIQLSLATDFYERITDLLTAEEQV